MTGRLYLSKAVKTKTCVKGGNKCYLGNTEDSVVIKAALFPALIRLSVQGREADPL